MYPDRKAPPQVLILICFSFVMLVVLLTFVSTMANGPTSGSFPTGVFYGIGIVSEVVGAFLALTRLSAAGSLSAPKFQTTMLICLAFAEFGALLGFVIHLSTGRPMWPMSAGSLAVMLLFILPRVIAFSRGSGGTRV